MKKSLRIIPLLFIVLLQSCIPTKKLIYLQEDHTTLQKKPSETYRFKKGDLIYINIKTVDEQLNNLLQVQSKGMTTNFSGENIYFISYIVDENGYIELPILGKIKAEGLTAEALKQKILEKLLATQLRNPQDVFIKVMPAGIFVTVLGEVKKTGSLHLFKDRPNVLEAIALAGDIQLTGNRRDVIIIRQKPDGETEMGHLDLTKKSAMNSPFFYLKNNDIVYVKPLPQKTIGTGTTLIQTLTTVMSITSFAISLYLFTRK